MENSEIIEEKVESVFRNKNFNLLFIGTIVSRFGDIIFNFAMGWYVLSLTGSAFKSGLFLSIGLLTLLFVQLFGGIIADKFNKVRIIYMMDFLSGISLLICFIGLTNSSYLSHTLHVQRNDVVMTILYIASFLLNFFGGIFSPASNALMPKIVKENQYQQAQSLFNIVSHLNNIVGLLFGGILIIIIKANGVFLLNGISFILSGISELFIKDKQEEDKGKVKFKVFINSLGQDMLNGFKYIVKETGLLQIIILAILINFFFGPILVIYPQYIFNQVLNRSAYEYSLVEIFFSIASILTAILLSIRKQPEKVFKYLLYGLLANFVVTMLTLVLFNLVMKELITFIIFMISFSIIMFLIGVILTFVNVPMNVSFMKKINKEVYGRVIAVFGTLVGIVNPISIMLFGKLVDSIGLLNSLSISVVGGVLGIIFLVTSKKLRSI